MQIDPLLQKVIISAVTLIGSYIIYEIISHFLKRIGKRLDTDLTVIQVLKEIFKYTIIALAITLILKVWGLDVGPLILSLGIVGIAVGFAARDTLSNFISGMFILAEKSFRVGDTIEISGQRGKIQKMGFRVTTMTTPDNKVITVPNSAFSKTPYLNFTTMDTRRVDLKINISYPLDLEQITPALLKAAGSLSWARSNPKPKILIKELSDVGVKATLSVWTNKPQKVAEYRTQLAERVKGILVEGLEDSENI
ncbi:mechanosensitive ion channel family protein [Methanobacterium sp. CWC-01]|uniref:mechanosensitive ion channel family protein n=1 Tax=Methanobacterium aridiramus TaxID=2584467 RepID=UPI0025759676|nr:mechanosensitive ion channel family protein [Methanobacterium sp. CWC-01]WJI10070.1 mechanosensitive ion channel family protein [Methanobacterium sp. CWC-01]